MSLSLSTGSSRSPLDDRVFFDTETTGLDPRLPGFKLIMVGIFVPPNPVEIFVGEDVHRAAKILDALQVAGKKLVCWNSIFDAKVLHQVCGVDLFPHDPMLMAYLLREDVRHDLKSTAVLRLGVQPWEHGIRERIKKGDIPDIEELAEYCAKDCVYLERLYEDLRREIVCDQALARLYLHLMLPASWELRRVEERGVYISQEAIDEAKAICSSKQDEARKACVAIAKQLGMGVFNPRSPRHVSELLFSRLKLPVVELTEGGLPSTKEYVLKKLKGKHPVVDAILEYRKWDKYYNFLIQYEDRRDEAGRVYPSYSLVRTVTGRTSSSNPNIQQLPRDPLIRGIVAAPPGRVLVAVDYSQIELRVAAWIAREQNMMDAFRRGLDIHTLMAQKLLGRDQVTSEERTRAKAMNFGFLYGAEAKTFQEYVLREYDMQISLEEASEYRRVFFSMWPGLLRWYEQVYESLVKDGVVRSPLGRIRHLPDIWSPQESVRMEALRQAINSPVQSMASDMTLLAMIELGRRGHEVVAFVHDSVVLEASEDEADRVASSAREVFEEVVPSRLRDVFGVDFDVPLVCEVKIGKQWR